MTSSSICFLYLCNTNAYIDQILHLFFSIFKIPCRLFTINYMHVTYPTTLLLPNSSSSTFFCLFQKPSGENCFLLSCSIHGIPSLLTLDYSIYCSISLVVVVFYELHRWRGGKCAYLELFLFGCYVVLLYLFLDKLLIHWKVIFFFYICINLGIWKCIVRIIFVK